jgi:hypothetical protein
VQFILRDLRVPIELHTYRLIELAAAAMIALVCLWAKWRNLPPARIHFLLFALAVCWMTALGPATEAMTYILVAPLICWLLIARKEVPGPLPWWVYLAIYLLFLFPTFAGLVPGHTTLRSPRLKFIQPAAAMLLMLATLIEVLAARSSGPKASIR